MGNISSRTKIDIKQLNNTITNYIINLNYDDLSKHNDKLHYDKLILFYCHLQLDRISGDILISTVHSKF